MQSRLYRNTPGSRVFDTVILALLTCYALVTLYPLIYTLVVSFSRADTPNTNFFLWPMRPHLMGYVSALRTQGLPRAYLNTILYASSGTLVTLTFTMLTAYPMSIDNFPFRKFFMLMITFTMLFSGGLIQSYLLIKNLGIMDSIWALILPGAVSAWNIIVVRTYLKSNIPKELTEAAVIDGAGHWSILLRIIMPLAKPILAVIALFTAVGQWNSYFAPMIYLNNRNKWPLALLLREYLAAHMNIWDDRIDPTWATVISDQTLRAATLIISIIPIMCVYPFLQRYFTKGILLGSLKG